MNRNHHPDALARMIMLEKMHQRAVSDNKVAQRHVVGSQQRGNAKLIGKNAQHGSSTGPSDSSN